MVIKTNDGTDSQKMLLDSRSTHASQCRAAGLRIYTYVWIIPGKVSEQDQDQDQDNILFIMVLIEFLLYLLH